MHITRLCPALLALLVAQYAGTSSAGATVVPSQAFSPAEHQLAQKVSYRWRDRGYGHGHGHGYYRPYAREYYSRRYESYGRYDENYYNYGYSSRYDDNDCEY